MQEHAGTKSDIIEIDDLFVYLAEQDKLRDLETENLKRQNEKLATVTENQTNEIGKRQAEIERLAYSRKTEIDPDDYEMFKIGLKELTKTEKPFLTFICKAKPQKKSPIYLIYAKVRSNFTTTIFWKNSAFLRVNKCCAMQLC